MNDMTDASQVEKAWEISLAVTAHWHERIISAIQSKKDSDLELRAALHKFAKRNPVKFYHLIGTYVLPNCSEDEARRLVVQVCNDADIGMPLYWFERYTDDFCEHKWGNTNIQELRTWITDLVSYSDFAQVETALNNNFTRCDDCGEWEARDATYRVYGSSDRCCRLCIQSDTYEYSHYYNQYIFSENGRNAIDNNGRECVIDCHDENFDYDEENDEWVHVDYSQRILGNYHSSKRLFKSIKSKWSETEHRYFGVELEVECKNERPYDVASSLHKTLNKNTIGHRCFFETDGSLSNGFEIITQPMGLDLHTEFWKWLQTDQTKGLLSHKTSTCGLHVHVSRRNITTLQLSKIITFVNSPDNRELIESIARRYANSYATIRSKKLGSAYKSNYDRYDAVNVQNSQTIEFRIFRGSLKYETVMASIEFVNALVSYCHDQSGYGFDLSSQSFQKFINKPPIRQDTKHLRHYLSDRGYSFTNEEGN